MFSFFEAYQKDSEIVKADYLRTVFLNLGFPSVKLRDENYLILSRKGMRRLVNNFVRYSVPYHKDFPDCDDFAKWAVADVGRASADEGFEYHPVFAYAEVKMKDGKERHALNIALVKDGCSIYTETDIFFPQKNAWGTLKDIEERYEVEI